jgi:hypothetical protein
MRLIVGVLVAVPIVCAVVLTARARSNRQRSLARMCADAGLAFSPTDPFSFTDTTFLPFPMFAPLADWQVRNVVASLYPPRPAEGPYEDRWLQGSWSADPTGVDAPNQGGLGG